MKTRIRSLLLTCLLFCIGFQFAFGQANTQYAISSDLGGGKALVTIAAPGLVGSLNYFFATNQTVTLLNNNIAFQLYFTSGINITFAANNLTTYYQPLQFTGLNRITFNQNNTPSSYATFIVYTPPTNSVYYTPVNSVVIPSDATGNVQIILESSSDLVNWIPSLPGTYGSTYTNRFFRVRAVAQ